jgi:hypothetical protein
VKKKSRWMVSVPSGEEDRNRAIIAPSLVGVNSVHTEKKSRRRWLTGGKTGNDLMQFGAVLARRPLPTTKWLKFG